MLNKKHLNLLVLASLVSVSAAAASQFAVVDMERAVNEVDEGAKAKVQLKKEYEDKQALLDKKQSELKSLQESYEKKSTLLKDDAKVAKAQELQKKYAEAQQMYMNMQQEMTKRQSEVMGTIVQKMQVILDAKREEGGFALILPKNATLSSPTSADLTSDVIRAYNKAYPAKSDAKKKS